jgi:thiol-disulfide isomerase/thioredoxin
MSFRPVAHLRFAVVALFFLTCFISVRATAAGDPPAKAGVSPEHYALMQFGSTSLPLPGGIDVPVERFAADSRSVVLWLPSERGVQGGMKRLAQGLAEAGQEVLIADVFAGWMLPPTDQSLRELPVPELASLIDAVVAVSGKPVLLMSHDRGSGPLLAALREWQRLHPRDERVRGVVLITPNLFVRTPDPGESGVLLPIASATNRPVALIQPELSPTYLRLPALTEALQKGGARVYQMGLPEVRDRFFFRPDATEVEQAVAGMMPDKLRQLVGLLEHESLAAEAAPLVDVDAPVSAERRRGLAPYAGKDAMSPPALRLRDAEGVEHDLSALRGKVVLLNFWASWCPPCLHEMPSMERLAAHAGERPFAIVAVNLGESPERIRAFIQKVNVGFPIWLDPDKASARRWNVFAFPTTYLLDHEGHIRYAVAGGIEWDEPQVLSVVDGLLKEAQ